MARLALSRRRRLFLVVYGATVKRPSPTASGQTRIRVNPQRSRYSGTELRRTEFTFSEQPVNHMVKSYGRKNWILYV